MHVGLSSARPHTVIKTIGQISDKHCVPAPVILIYIRPWPFSGYMFFHGDDEILRIRRPGEPRLGTGSLYTHELAQAKPMQRTTRDDPSHAIIDTP